MADDKRQVFEVREWRGRRDRGIGAAVSQLLQPVDSNGAVIVSGLQTIEARRQEKRP